MDINGQALDIRFTGALDNFSAERLNGSLYFGGHPQVLYVHVYPMNSAVEHTHISTTRPYSQPVYRPVFMFVPHNNRVREMDTVA